MKMTRINKKDYEFSRPVRAVVEDISTEWRLGRHMWIGFTCDRHLVRGLMHNVIDYDFSCEKDARADYAYNLWDVVHPGDRPVDLGIKLVSFLRKVSCERRA